MARVTKKEMIEEYDYILGYTVPALKRDLQERYPRRLNTLLFKLSFINSHPREDWKVKEIKSILEHLKDIVVDCTVQ